MLEQDMVDISYEYLLGLPNIIDVKKEIPFLSRCIDIVMIDDFNEIISIEFKVKKWRHAIEQAVNHNLGADKAYICLPKRNITETLRNAIEEAGIGLLMYDNSQTDKIVEAIPVRNGKKNISVFRKMLLNNYNNV